jgi:signal transduction histidine kinase
VEREPPDRGRPLWQHAFFYSWLVLASIGPVIDEVRAGKPVLLPLALIAALALWYAFWRVLRDGAADDLPAPYIAGAAVLWLTLVAVDASFILLGLNVFVPFCLRNRRVGMTVVLLCAAGWLWQRVEASNSVSWAEVVVAMLIGVSGVAAVGYVSTFARLHAEQRRLIERLETEQAARAAAERAAGVAAERQRLARDIHDTLTQGFASIVMLLEAAEASSPGQPANRHVSQALRAARDNLAESRRVVWALRPAQLGDGALSGVIRGLAARFTDETGILVEVMVTGTARPLDPDAQTALLRVTQEALSNVRRHAHADRVDVTLSYLDDVVVLDVQDDGRGFDLDRLTTPGEQLTGLGLRTMRERVHELGGSVAVESVPGDGTTVAVTLSVSSSHDAARSPEVHVTADES